MATKFSSNGHGGDEDKPVNGQIVPRTMPPPPDVPEDDTRIRDARILDMRAQGHPISVIAGEFGMAKSSVHKAIRRALAMVGSPSAEEVRRMADIALDRNLRELNKVLTRTHFASAANGKLILDPVTGDPLIDDQPVILAAREIREHWESRRKMHGADAPTRHVNAQIPEAVVAERIRELQARTGTSGIDDPAVRQLLGIEAPLEDGYGDDGDADG